MQIFSIRDRSFFIRGGGSLKKYGFEKEGQEENIGCKGGEGYPKNSFKFCSDGGCDNANIPFLPECQKPVFLMLRKFKLSRGRKRPDPYFIMHQKAILPHQNGGWCGGGISIKLGYKEGIYISCN